MLYTDLIIDEMKNIFHSKDHNKLMKRSGSFDFKRRGKLNWKLERRHSAASSDYKSDNSEDSHYTEYDDIEDDFCRHTSKKGYLNTTQ